MRRAWALACALALGACAAPLPAPTPAPSPQATPQTALPPMREFGPPRPLPPTRSNTEIARDFLDLSFQLESGDPLPVFTRFEQPITVALTGRVTPTLSRELDRLIERLRREAGLDIRRSNDPQTASITVEGVTSQMMAREVPQAACFVLPTRVDWQGFTGNGRALAYDWTELEVRRTATVFLPSDNSPQDIRDCLHEEIAQALGPLNDLFRLSDSIFNDDNLNAVLTGFDMLVLRATYHPSLRSGLTRDQVAARLPGILAGLNPRGNGIPSRPYQPSPKAWVADMNRALGTGSASAGRKAARRALSTALQQGWDDSRTALSYFVLGRAEIGRNNEAALEALVAAGNIYKRRDETQIHAAHVGFQIAAFALSAGEWDVVLNLCDRYEPVAQRAENAALLSDLLLTRAAALKATGQPYRAVERDGLAWGRYASTSPEMLRQRAAEIARLAERAGV